MQHVFSAVSDFCRHLVATFCRNFLSACVTTFFIFLIFLKFPRLKSNDSSHLSVHFRSLFYFLVIDANLRIK